MLNNGRTIAQCTRGLHYFILFLSTHVWQSSNQSETLETLVFIHCILATQSTGRKHLNFYTRRGVKAKKHRKFHPRRVDEPQQMGQDMKHLKHPGRMLAK